jgi:hypothetical protein
MIAQVGYSVAGRSRGQVAPRAVCTVHVEMRSASFLVEPQNQGRWFGLKITRTIFIGLALKPVVTVSDGLASKPAAMVSSGLASKSAMMVFTGLTSKPVATILLSLASKLVTTVSPGLASKPVVGFLVEPQNQGGGGFLGLVLKTGCSSLMIWASKSP